jgi:hypothetical protein
LIGNFILQKLPLKHLFKNRILVLILGLQLNSMTSEAVRQQIKETLEALDRSTAKATKSKAAAIKYLVELGLIEDVKPLKN